MAEQQPARYHHHHQTWDENYQELKEYWEEHGHSRPKATTKLGRWAAEQRTRRRRGVTGMGAAVDNTSEEQQRRIKLLNQINFDWESGQEKKEKRWQFMFGLLKDYKKEMGHLIPKQKQTYRGESLGNWVTSQQSNYREGDIQEHRKRQLNDIGFVWVRDERLLWKGSRPLGKLDEDWNERFDRLCEYKEEHGDTLVPTSYPPIMLLSGEEFHLGSFVNRQRQLYSKGQLRLERKEKLENIGFVFEIDIYDAEASQNQKVWDAMFLKLSRYKDEYGNCDIPVVDEDDAEKYSLGNWARHQRSLYSRGKLAEPRYERLDALGFTWSPHQARWEEMVSHLRAYRAEHGDCLVPDAYVTPKGNANLGTWVRTVRGARRGTKGDMELSADRIAELDKLGFEWENVLIKQWDIMFDALKRYKEKHGDCRVPLSYSKAPDDESERPTNLGSWVSQQRQALGKKQEAKCDPMFAKRKARLEEIGFEFSLAHVNQENWETMLEALIKYKEQFGDCHVPYSYDGDDDLPRSLGKWVYDQRTKVPSRAAAGHLLSAERREKLDAVAFDYSKKSSNQRELLTKTDSASLLSADREKKLNDIGFDWDGNTAHRKWMQMFDRLKIHHAANGNCRVPGDYDKDCDGLPAKLGNWVGVQKRVAPSKAECGHPVYVERQKLLDSIGFEYDHVREAKWEEMFERLKQYRFAHGDCRVSKDYDDGKGKNPTLFSWTRNQRMVLERAEKGEAKYMERKRLLDSLQYDWERVDDARWSAMFAALKIFREQKGHCDVP
jgi:hypothetical protein